MYYKLKCPALPVEIGKPWDKCRILRPGLRSVSFKNVSQFGPAVWQAGIFLVYDFWTPPRAPLLSFLYMGLTESVLT